MQRPINTAAFRCITDLTKAFFNHRYTDLLHIIFVYLWLLFHTTSYTRHCEYEAILMRVAYN